MKTLLSQASQNSEQTSQMEEIDLNDSHTIQSNDETTTDLSWNKNHNIFLF